MVGDNWPTVEDLQSLGILLVEDGNHGEYRPRREEFCKRGVAFIRAADMSGGVINFRECEHINQVAASRIRKGIGRPGDIILSHKGTVGKLARAQSDAPPFVCSPQTTFWRVLDETKLDPSYLHAFMRSQLFSTQLASVQGETDMAPYVSLSAQRKLRVAFPSLHEQTAIGRVLTVLDEKISANRNLSETLEAAAQTLFKSWFVNFDPVHAKIEGRPTGLVEKVDNLFPARLGEDSLPEGWQRIPVGDIIELLDYKRVPLSSSERKKRRGKIPYYGATSAMDYIDDFLFDEKLTLVGEDGSVVRKDGSAFTQYIWGKSWVNNHAHVIRGKRISVEQLKCFFDTCNVSAYITGAVQPKLNQANLTSIPFVKASDQLHSIFDSVAETLYERVRSATEETRILKAIFDAILPRLLSGELRTADAERHIAAA